jgi:hypothetical protein
MMSNPNHIESGLHPQFAFDNRSGIGYGYRQEGSKQGMPHLNQQSQYDHVNQNQNGLNINWSNNNPTQVQSMFGGQGHQENIRGNSVNVNALHGINTELAAERLLASQMQGSHFNQNYNIPAGMNYNPVGSNVMNAQPP